MSADVLAVRRAYEMGRARVAMRRASVAALVVAVLAGMVLGRAAAVWAIAPLAVIAFAEWRGGALARGVRRGVLAGLVTLIVPLSWLRPCCDAAALASGSCCTMPSMCGVSGAVVGLAMALVWPRENGARKHALAGAGVALGALSVGAARCSALFFGESIGLALGLLAGIAASTLARSWLQRAADR